MLSDEERKRINEEERERYRARQDEGAKHGQALIFVIIGLGLLFYFMYTGFGWGN